MSDNVNHPNHYTGNFGQTNIECIDITRHLNFDIGNAFKYIWRAGHKGSIDKAIEDLNKALWYIKDWRSNLLGGRGNEYLALCVFKLLRAPEEGTLDALRHAALLQLIEGTTKDAEELVYKMIQRFRNEQDRIDSQALEAGSKDEEGEDR